MLISLIKAFGDISEQEGIILHFTTGDSWVGYLDGVFLGSVWTWKLEYLSAIILSS